MDADTIKAAAEIGVIALIAIMLVKELIERVKSADTRYAELIKQLMTVIENNSIAMGELKGSMTGFGALVEEVCTRLECLEEKMSIVLRNQKEK